MFDLSIQNLDIQKENSILKKNINLDKNLDCFILVSSKDKTLAENILNNIIENIIDKISTEDTYNDFGIALENINAFLKSWRKDNISEKKEQKIGVIISLLNGNNFMFSNIGKTSVCMINSNSQIIELTEKGENKKDFLYISSGNLANGDIILTSSSNLLKYLSKSDIKDSMILADDMEVFGKNIINILKSEIVKKNVLLACLRYKNEYVKSEYENSKLDSIKNFFIGLGDTKIFKTIVGKSLLLKDKINLQSKKNKNIFFIISIILAIIFLYFIVNALAGTSTKTEIKQEAKNDIKEIDKFIKIASENVQNPELFRKNITTAEKMIKQLETKNLYKGDITRINDEIDILKKQFNKVEIFKADAGNLIYSEKIVDPILMTKQNGKVYIITKKGVIGPILQGSKAKVYMFNDLKEKEYFTDCAFIGNNIFLLTNTSKIARFSSNSFAYVKVSGQETWEEIKEIDSYSSNLYTLGKDNQIYKHKALTSAFSVKTPYLKTEDLKNIGNVLDFAIDGGFYIVKDDLSVVKFFSSPYRIESLFLNNLPQNYSRENGTKFEIKAGFNLNYVYMFLNNKIWVFGTNSKNYADTTNLNYLGQIEGESENKIIDFFVEKDGEILVLNEKGVFRLKFDVSDNKISVR